MSTVDAPFAGVGSGRLSSSPKGGLTAFCKQDIQTAIIAGNCAISSCKQQYAVGTIFIPDGEKCKEFPSQN